MEMAAGLQDRLEFFRSNLVQNFDKTYQNLEFQMFQSFSQPEDTYQNFTQHGPIQVRT